MTWPKKYNGKDKYKDKDNYKDNDIDNPRDLSHLRHWSQFWQLRTLFYNNLFAWQLRATLDSIRNSCDVSCHTRKALFWRPEKRGPSCPNWGVGGGLLIWAMPESKRLFYLDAFPNFPSTLLSTFFIFFLQLLFLQFSLAIVPILATRWSHLYWFHVWPLDSTTCTSCRFGQQLGLLELVASLATKCCHLHKFPFWPPGGATCIATLPRIALLTSSAGVELLSSSARVTSVKSAKPLGWSDIRTHRSDPRDTWVR